ncbi:MAG: nucleoside monophosphate kinase [Alphaproteobacteria bacterium]|nr:nucleoside monophosphate kinase [Alphaproteobacteria bacterium]
MSNNSLWIVLLGAPGCGKGTQAEFLVSENCFSIISVGELLRANKSKFVEKENKTIGDIISGGSLLPDEVVMDLVSNELLKIKDVSSKNLIFDGFPRTIGQATVLDSLISKFGKKIDCVLNFNIEDEVIKKRILGRYKCSKCGKIYNDFFLKPKNEGICDICGCKTFDRRADDNEESLQKRLSEYHKKTVALKDFYKSSGVLKNINADAEFSEVRKSVLNSLNLG